MPINSDDFRDALRNFPAGVTVVTVKSGDRVHGLTVSAFASVSPTPPLICVIVDHKSESSTLMERSDAVFAVNILRDDQEEISNTFAWKEEDRFAVAKWETAVTGAPVLTDCMAWLDCTVYSRHTAGTHTIYIGEVQASKVMATDERPLVYWNRSYRKVTE